MFIDLFLAIFIPSCIGFISYSTNMGSDWFKSGFVFGSDWFQSGTGTGSNWFRVSNSNHDLLVQSYSGYINNYLSTVNSYSDTQYSLSTVSYRSKSSFDKTLVPTFDKTLAPTLNPTSDTTISFESTMSLSGISKPFLDDLAQTSVVIATAKSANVSTSFVFFIKQVPSSNKFLKSVSYDIDATTQLNVPTNGKSPQILYDSLVSNLVNSVSNGDFNAFLMSASIALNSSSTQNAFSNGVVLGPLSFDGPSFAPSFAPVGVPSSMPSHDEGKTVFIILVFLILIVFLGSLYIKHKQERINIEIESI